MISGAFKKLAKENGMQISNGVAYGSLRGYTATLKDGAGSKYISFATGFKDPNQLTQLKAVLVQYGDKQLLKDFRVAQMFVDPKCIRFVFADSFGTMKKIYAFLDWFIPLLNQFEATPAGVCNLCGAPLENGSWIMMDDVCYYAHQACADSLDRQLTEQNEQKKQERTGSYLRGFVGAILGAALGAVVWGIVLMVGYIASAVGLLIGWLAGKGYDLLKGKQGKGKVAILALAVICGVVLGTMFAALFAAIKTVLEIGSPYATISDVPEIMGVVFANSEFWAAAVKDILIGLLFAGLGVFVMLKNTGKEVSDSKVKKLR